MIRTIRSPRICDASETAAANAHVAALGALRPGSRIRVRGTSSAAVDRFCASHHGPIGDIGPDDRVSRYAIVITCTTSTTPVYVEPARSDTLIVAVGSFRPTIAEVAPATVRASAIWVDDSDGARHEAGDLIRAGVDWADVGSLVDLIRHPQGIADDRPRLFKSVGCAAWDLAAARVAVACLGQSIAAP